MLPCLLKLLLTYINSRKEIVRVSTMKLIEFILETKGCSLESSIIVILKVILKTYPTNEKQNYMVQDSFSMLNSSASEMLSSPRTNKTKISSPKNNSRYNPTSSTQKQRLFEPFRNVMPTEASKVDEPNSGITNMLKNLYNHVLDMYISVLSSISSHILH